MKNQSLWKIVVDSLYTCPDTFTKEELKLQLERKDIVVQDLDTLFLLLLEKESIIENKDGTYQISVEKAFQTYRERNQQNRKES